MKTTLSKHWKNRRHYTVEVFTDTGGYKVKVFTNGPRAMHFFESQANQIDPLCDVVLLEYRQPNGHERIRVKGLMSLVD